MLEFLEGALHQAAYWSISQMDEFKSYLEQQMALYRYFGKFTPVQAGSGSKRPEHILLLSDGLVTGQNILSLISKCQEEAISYLSLVIDDGYFDEICFLVESLPLVTLFIDFLPTSSADSLSAGQTDDGEIRVNLIRSSTDQNEVFLAHRPMELPAINLVISTQEIFDMTGCMAWNIGFAELVHLPYLAKHSGFGLVSVGLTEALRRYSLAKQNFGK